MQAKKKLIARLALWTGAVLLVAAVTGIGGLVAESRDQWLLGERQERDKKDRVEKARSYLAEIAKRLSKLPVDPTLVGEIESRFFEEQASGPFYVWAMDTKGDFLFGVPQSAFRKLNALYDREVTPRLREGVLLDRQTFLLSLVDDSSELGGGEASEGGGAEIVERGMHWNLHRSEPPNTFVLSSPLKTGEGVALGSLYLKRSPIVPDDRYRTDERIQILLAVSAGVLAASCAFLWVLLPTWVFVDARERGVRRAPLFAFLTVLSSLAHAPAARARSTAGLSVRTVDASCRLPSAPPVAIR